MNLAQIRLGAGPGGGAVPLRQEPPLRDVLPVAASTSCGPSSMRLARMSGHTIHGAPRDSPSHWSSLLP